MPLPVANACSICVRGGPGRRVTRAARSAWSCGYHHPSKATLSSARTCGLGWRRGWWIRWSRARPAAQISPPPCRNCVSMTLDLKASAVSLRLRLLLSVPSLRREWAAGELIAVCSEHSVPVVAALDADLEQTPEVHRAAMVNAYDAGAGGILYHRYYPGVDNWPYTAADYQRIRYAACERSHTSSVSSQSPTQKRAWLLADRPGHPGGARQDIPAGSDHHYCSRRLRPGRRHARDS